MSLKDLRFGSEAHGLNLNDPDDKSLFVSRVSFSLRYMYFKHIKEACEAHGKTFKRRSSAIKFLCDKYVESRR